MKNRLIILTIFVIFFSCNSSRKNKKLFIVSQDTFCVEYDKVRLFKAGKSNTEPAWLIPPPPPGLEFYSHTVVIFDSLKNVYLYQTEENDNQISDCSFKSITAYPNFIHLNPEQLLAFKSENFCDFIRSNSDILGFDSAKTYRHPSFIYLASVCDTIQNDAFYDFINLIRPKLRDKARNNRTVNYFVRRTTEEENVVLMYKKQAKLYEPQKVKWSSNFIMGNVKPYTPVYDSAEKKMMVYIRSCLGLKPYYYYNFKEIK